MAPALRCWANSPGLYRLTFVTRTFAQQRSAGAIQTYQVNAASFGAGMVLSGMLAIGPANAGEPSGIACITTPTINDAARFFGFDSGGFERAAMTTNSVWTGSVWNRDDVSKVAWRAEFDPAADSFAIYRAAAG